MNYEAFQHKPWIAIPPGAAGDIIPVSLKQSMRLKNLEREVATLQKILWLLADHNGGGIFPASDLCYCAYDGRDEAHPRDMYFGTAGELSAITPGYDIGLANQKIGSVPQEFRVYGTDPADQGSPKARFYTKLGMKVASIWIDVSGHLHIKMDVDNCFDVIFEAADVLRPRSIRFER